MGSTGEWALEQRREQRREAVTGPAATADPVIGEQGSRDHAAYESLPPSQHIGLQLRQIQGLAHAFETQLADALDCNPTDLAAMQALIDDGPMSPSQLAGRLGVTTAAVTHVVDRLAGLGHVTRADHDSDRRRKVVVPAPASIAAAVEELRPIIEGVTEAIEQLSDRDRGVVETFLQQVIDIYAGALRD